VVLILINVCRRTFLDASQYFLADTPIHVAFPTVHPKNATSSAMARDTAGQRKTVMKSFIAGSVLFLILSGAALSQTRLEFEVASIRPSNPQGPQFTAGVQVDGAQVRFGLVPLISYIGYAYDVRNYQIVGPDWLRSERFDIVAKLPDGAAITQRWEMLRSLLMDRFGLKVHRETQEFPVYVLEIAKGGLKIKEQPRDPAAPEIDEKVPSSVTVVADRTGTTFSLGGESYFSAGNKGVEGKKLSMAGFVYMLTPFLDHPTIDGTGLKGVYDFVLDISPEDLMVMGVRAAVNGGAGAYDRLQCKMPDATNVEGIHVPALSVQPLIENAIRHGIAQRIDGGQVSVEVERNGTQFSLTVMNDCELSAERSPGTFFRGGHALENIRERLRLHYGDRASLTVSLPRADAVAVTVTGPAQ
jgi:uncharacterized protein (TIGR03435 family)